MAKPDLAGLETTIEKAFEERDQISAATRGEVREAIETALDLLGRGQARVAERQPDGSWSVNQWLKKAVLLSFRLNPMEIIKGGSGDTAWWDKVPSKFSGWGAVDFEKAGFRAVPGAIVRRSAYIAPGVVLMPSFVNVGRTSTRHDGRHLGVSRLLRTRSAERASVIGVGIGVS